MSPTNTDGDDKEMTAEQCRKEIAQLQDSIDELRDANEGVNHFTAANEWQITDCNLRTVRELVGHFGKIYACRWSSDSKHLVSASQDGTLLVWNAFNRMKTQAICLRSAWVMTCAFGPSRQTIACGGLDNVCTVYRLTDAPDDGSPLKRPHVELGGHEGYLSCVRYIDDKTMITSSGDSTCILWDIETRRPKVTFSGHESDVMCVAPTSDGKMFVSGSCDTTAKVWDLRNGERPVHTFTGHESDINSVTFYPDDKAFGSGSDDSSCRLFDMRSLSQLNMYTDDSTFCGIPAVEFSKSGNYMFAAYDDAALRVWDTVGGFTHQVLRQHKSRVGSLDVSPDGQALATASWDQIIRIWSNDTHVQSSSRTVSPNDELKKRGLV
eukprot:39477_1